VFLTPCLSLLLDDLGGALGTKLGHGISERPGQQRQEARGEHAIGRAGEGEPIPAAGAQGRFEV
jgi:hypothetical protein